MVQVMDQSVVIFWFLFCNAVIARKVGDVAISSKKIAVIPAQAGIHYGRSQKNAMDSGLRRNDD